MLISSRLRQLSIIAGTNLLTEGGERRTVVEAIPHQRYHNRLNDIALMKLDYPLPLSNSIRAIKIASNEISPDLPIVIAGWGKTSAFGTITTRLKVNTLRTMSRRRCAHSLGTRHSGLLCLRHSKNNGACYVSSKSYYSSWVT